MVVVACSSLRWQLCRAEKIGVKLEGITTCAWQGRANGEAARLLSHSLSRHGYIRARGELGGVSAHTERPRCTRAGPRVCCFFSACPPCSTATDARASFAPGQVPTRQVQPRVSPSHIRPARLHPGTHCIGHNRGSILAGRYLRCRRFQGHAELTHPAVPLQCAAGPRQVRVTNARHQPCLA